MAGGRQARTLPGLMPSDRPAVWDLTALLNAADARASLPERNLWLIRLLEWLRHGSAAASEASAATPTPVLRLKHLLGVLERHGEHGARVGALLNRIWQDVDSAALLADFGFASGVSLWGELMQRLRARLLPLTPATTDLGELFELLFPAPDDARWLLAIDDDTLARLGRYMRLSGDDPSWRQPFLDAIVYLASAVRASAYSPDIRQRMSPELLVDQPFRQLSRVAERVGELALAVDAVQAGAPEASGGHGPAAGHALLQESQYLRALLTACRRCADSVSDHLELHGISVDLVFETDQLRARTLRIEALLNCVLSPEPARDIVRLLGELVRAAQEGRSLRALLSLHYSLLARRVAERGAQAGEHYITRDRVEYRAMLRSAAGGGAILAATTFIKFGLLAIFLSTFWGGFWAGVNYAASFVVVQLLHFTVATKQPAMTAPAMAQRLVDLTQDVRVEGFVDEVTHLIRSQAAGIFGNLMVVAPLVLGLQWLSLWVHGAPIVGAHTAEHVLQSLTLLGPTALYAALTGVLLFASSLIAGWAENWFVWHRLDSAIAWNPRIVAALGSARAGRWSIYGRAQISGLAANLSLGMMLGIVPVVALFFGLPIEVRHVTLSTGQLAAAVGALGLGTLGHPPFWWCAAGIAVTGLLNVSVSFSLAFLVALRSRGLRVADRHRIRAAIGQRLRTRPLDFIWPPS